MVRAVCSAGKAASASVKALRRTGAPGIVRRNVYDPLEPTREPRWYEVRDMHGRILESSPLPAGTDLKRAFVVAMLEHM
jgi:hypothetical protein